MKVDFYTATPDMAATTGTYLFTDQYALMMEGQNVEHAGKQYRVKSLEWLDEARHFLNAYVVKYPPRS